MTEKKEVGKIKSFYKGVGRLSGLPNVFPNEVLLSERKEKIAVVIGYNSDYVEALFFDSDNIDLSQKIFRSKEQFLVGVGKKYLGRVINGFGEPIDGLGIIRNDKFSPVFREAPGIIDREKVTEPLLTGIKIIDSVLPIGRGQRELIVGDKKLGKTTIALDALINQKYNSENSLKEVYGIYVIIGQKREKAKEVIEELRSFGVLEKSVIVAATADDSLLSQYLAPYVGCAIAEYFRDNGKDALIIYDDLSKHAKAYREISLLLERPPGREAYPGDVFYLHASLLERAGKLSSRKGGGSLTALPIIETLENDITAFIPTNLISITDGQIYLDPDLFSDNFLPAVNIGLSVSRVGSQAQPKILRMATKSLKLAISQYQSLKKLVQLETSLSSSAKEKFNRGELITEALKQEKHQPVSLVPETVIFYGLLNGLFGEVNKKEWSNFEIKIIDYLESSINKRKIKIESESDIRSLIKKVKSEFQLKA